MSTISPVPSLPVTEADCRVLEIAEWLDKEGYTPAARVLRVMIQRHSTVELETLKGDPSALERLLAANPSVRIWAAEHRMYWRAGAGYTDTTLEAEICPFMEAYACTFHCRPKERITFEILPEAEPTPPRESGWKS